MTSVYRLLAQTWAINGVKMAPTRAIPLQVPRPTDLNVVGNTYTSTCL